MIRSFYIHEGFDIYKFFYFFTKTKICLENKVLENIYQIILYTQIKFFIIMKKKLLYYHIGDFSNPEASHYQVTNMCKSFSKYFNTCLIGLKKEESIVYDLNGFKYRIYDYVGKFYKRFSSDNLSIWYLIHKNLNNIFLLLRTRKYVKKSDYIYTRDIIVAYVLRTFFRKKIILEIHELNPSSIWKFFLRRIKNRMFRIITTTQNLKDDLIKLGHKSNKIEVLSNGIRLGDFNKVNDKKSLRIKYEIPTDKKIVLYLGSFILWKGCETLLDASKNFDNDIQLVMVGGDKQKSKELKKKYNNVIFFGRVRNSIVHEFLSLADVLVLPNNRKTLDSIRYTSPLKLFEYIASKRPVVASDLPSIRAIVNENEVMFFEPENSKDLSEKINTILKDKKLANKLVNNSYEKMKNNTWDNRAKRISQIFTEKR
jgi:glycosyltransferase involved in cell wall biosynthesis